MTKTKIVCTIGPSSDSPETIHRMIQEGMSLARLNFSHGSHAEHLEKLRVIRAASAETGRPVAILQDLCGPKIRVGEVCEPGATLAPGQTLILTSLVEKCSHQRISVSYPDLPREVNIDDRILLADGMMELVVRRTTETDIHCEVIIGGVLTSHKGINLPTGTIKAPAITEKDHADILFGLAHGVDFIALSFVRDASDIERVKDIIRDAGKRTPVIAKIEKHEALDHIDAIIDASDGIMVARGDLGVEIPLEQVPGVQKQLVKKANAAGKPVIIATQMLRSMVDAPRPTRAEATDVANAVLDGADAVMLSEETASGKYPVEAVQYMKRIIGQAEIHYPHETHLYAKERTDISESVAHAACILAEELNATAIVATTRSGFTARQISKFKPHAPIVALSPEESTTRELNLSWGCVPFQVADIRNTDELIERTAAFALEQKIAKTGDVIILTTGHPVWVTGTTNMLRVIHL